VEFRDLVRFELDLTSPGPRPSRSDGEDEPRFPSGPSALEAVTLAVVDLDYTPLMLLCAASGYALRVLWGSAFSLLSTM
jgi:hypothetical protein